MARVVNTAPVTSSYVSIINCPGPTTTIYGFDFDRKWTDNNQVWNSIHCIREPRRWPKLPKRRGGSVNNGAVTERGRGVTPESVSVMTSGVTRDETWEIRDQNARREERERSARSGHWTVTKTSALSWGALTRPGDFLMFLCPQSLTLTTPSHLTRDDQVKFEMKKLRYAVAELYIYVYITSKLLIIKV